MPAFARTAEEAQAELNACVTKIKKDIEKLDASICILNDYPKDLHTFALDHLLEIRQDLMIALEHRTSAAERGPVSWDRYRSSATIKNKDLCDTDVTKSYQVIINGKTYRLERNEK